MTQVHKEIKKAEDETTDIICVIDRSTSIKTSGLVESTIEGFNAFLSEQKKAVGKAKLTLCLFDGGVGYGAVPGKTYEIIHDRVDIQSVPELNTETYVPKGMTAMYDAIGVTIDTVYNQWKDSAEKPDKVVFLIMTDGMENASQEYTQKTVFEAITKRKTDDNWVFLFIGANINTMEAGAGLGISKGNTMAYSNSSRGVSTGYSNIAVGVSSLRSKSKDELFGFAGVTGSVGFEGPAGLDSILKDNGVEKEDLDGNKY